MNGIIKYGSFESEQRVNKYFAIVIERPNCVVKTGAVIYPCSIHLSDVSTHKFVIDGEKCKFSPTGKCSCYDDIRWESIEIYVPPKIVAEILIERLQKVLPLLEWEITEIRNSILDEGTFVKGE